MPKPVRYKSNSIIYFQGDISEKVFVLNEGHVSMTFRDIETGKEMRELIQKGEFFGVKSALGRYPREEDVTAISDCILLMFTVQEFEDFAARNTRVIMKMLKVFSNQLRRIHTKVRTLLALDNQIEPEIGLLRTADYFYSKRRMGQALYAYTRYLELFPNGRYTRQAQDGVDACAPYADGSKQPPASASQPRGGTQFETPTLEGAAQRFYEALSLFGRERYDDALKIFQEISESGDDPEYRDRSAIEIGRCFYYLKRYSDAVAHLSRLVQNTPKLPGIENALFYIARSFSALGKKDRARAFYQRILAMTNLEPEFRHKVTNTMRKLEGGL